MNFRQFTLIIWIVLSLLHEAIKWLSRIETEQWGKSVVKDLAEFLQKIQPDLKGFSDKNLWRMKQFYQTCKAFPKLSALLREISWTNNLIILSRAKSVEEQEFYIRLSSQEKFSSR